MPRVGRRPRWGVPGDVDERLWLRWGNLDGVEGGESGVFAVMAGFVRAGADRLGRDLLIK